MQPTLNVARFLRDADPFAMLILVLLLAMSLGSWYLIVSRGLRAASIRRRSRHFLAGFHEAADLQAAAAWSRSIAPDDPFARLAQRGLAAVDQCAAPAKGMIGAVDADEFLGRALRRSLDQERARLERGLPFLATVASSAPFIGLLGTVWGIYHALAAIGASGQGTLDKVAGPVGEALLMTGVGLAVAIPAAIGYNALVHANRALLAELGAFAHDFATFLATGSRLSAAPARARAAAGRTDARSPAPAGLAPQAGH